MNNIKVSDPSKSKKQETRQANISSGQQCIRNKVQGRINICGIYVEEKGRVQCSAIQINRSLAKKCIRVLVRPYRVSSSESMHKKIRKVNISFDDCVFCFVKCCCCVVLYEGRAKGGEGEVDIGNNWCRVVRF